jgi:hypothetical protein
MSDTHQHFRSFVPFGLLWLHLNNKNNTAKTVEQEAVMDHKVKTPKGWLLGISTVAFAAACVPMVESQKMFCWTDVKSGAMSCTPIRPGEVQRPPVGGSGGFIHTHHPHNPPGHRPPPPPPAPAPTPSSASAGPNGVTTTGGGGSAAASNAGVVATSQGSSAAASSAGAVATGVGSAAAASSAGVAVSSGGSGAAASSAGVSVSN